MCKLNTDTKIYITGGDGFLGKHLVRKMQQQGYINIFVPKIEDYDLIKLEDIKRMYDDSDAEVVIHLAAVVGGIGANRENPGKFFYDNAIMDIQKKQIHPTDLPRKCFLCNLRHTESSIVSIQSSFCPLTCMAQEITSIQHLHT